MIHKNRLVCILLFLSLIVWGWFFITRDFNPDIPARGDDCLYLTLAKSFSQGTGFRDVSLPFERNAMVVPTAFPLLLTAYWKLIDPEIIVLKILLGFMLIAGVWLSFLWMRRILPKTESYLIALSFSAMPMFVLIGNSVLTETLFIPILYASFLLIMRSGDRDAPPWASWLAVACIVVLARTRMVGLPFLLVFLVVLASRREWLKVGAALLCIGVWVYLERLMVPAGFTSEGYLSGIAAEYPVRHDPVGAFFLVLEHYRHNLWSFAGSMYANMHLPWLYGLAEMNPLKRILVCAFFINGCTGLWILWKEHGSMRPLIIAMILSLVPVFSWPRTGTIFRYLFPYFPVMAAAAILPLLVLVGKSRNRAVVLLPAFFLCVMAANQAAATIGTRDTDVFLSDKNDLRAVHEFIAAAPEKPDCIVSFQQRYSYLKTGIVSVSCSRGDDILAIAEKWPEVEVWGVIDPTNMYCDALRSGTLALGPYGTPLYGRGNQTLYRLKRRDAPPSEALPEPPQERKPVPEPQVPLSDKPQAERRDVDELE